MKTRLFSQGLVNIIGHFDANISMSDELPKYLASISHEARDKLEDEMLTIIKHETLSVDDIYDSTSFYPIDLAKAQEFFKDVYNYAFRGGAEPDIDEYMD